MAEYDDEFQSGKSIDEYAKEAEKELANIAAQEAKKIGAEALHKLFDKAFGLVWEKIKPYVTVAAIILAIVIIAFLLLFGASDYIQEAINDFYNTNILHMGVAEDDYQTSYLEQAQGILAEIENGGIPFGNDMMVLSKEDYIMILNYVIEYNEQTTYETNPERVRYAYKQEVYNKAQEEETGMPGDWETETAYALQTLSYQTLGKDMESNTMDNEFAVPWQTIVVLCEMMSENNYENYGSDVDGWDSEHYEDFLLHNDNFEVSMDGYFITDSQVKSICSMVSYTYDVYNAFYRESYRGYGYDYIENTLWAIENGKTHQGFTGPDSTWGIDLGYDIDDGTYQLKAPYVISEGGYEYHINKQKVPALAPKNIYNYYMKIDYIYEADPSNDEEYKCVKMVSEVDAARFMKMVKQYIPDFTFDHFFELMEMLPGSEKEIEKYKKLETLYLKGEQAQEDYETEAESGLTPTITREWVAQQYKQTWETDSFASKGLYVSLSAMTEDSKNTTDGTFKGENSVWIGTHYDSNGNIVAEYNDFFPVSEGARMPLNNADNITRDELAQMLQYIKKHYGGDVSNFFDYDVVIDALYDWGNDNNMSVTNMLAITMHENPYTLHRDANIYSSNDWNMMGIICSGSDGYEVSYHGGTHKFRNYKKKFLPESLYNNNKATHEQMAPYFAQAITSQFDMISKNYIAKGQDTYYRMQFNTFNLTVADEAKYQEEEGKITHSYCPWWDDTSFPESYESATQTSGWCNAIAEKRGKLFGAIGKVIDKPLIFPLQTYTRVSDEFGARICPVHGEEFHYGIDLASPEGTKIYAAADGEVIENYYSASAGNKIKIKHDDGIYQTSYYHMRDRGLYEVGEKVKQGEVIGYVGSTGASTGYHLHFEVKQNGELINPRTVLTLPATNTDLSPTGTPEAPTQDDIIEIKSLEPTTIEIK